MKINKKQCIEYIIVGLIFTALLGMFLYFQGTLQSGYHLQDDHEFYTTSKRISEIGVGTNIILDIRSDSTIRFRPLYIFTRVLGISVLGTNFKLWSIFKAIEISLAMTGFYIFARQRKMNCFYSVIFSLFILVGEQSEIWWRLGPQESGGVLLCAVALLATNWLSKENSKIRKVVFILSLSLLSLQKESFLIMLPGFFLLLWAFEVEESENQCKKWNVLVNEFIKRHLVEILVVGILLLLEMFVIVFHTGTDSIGYAGISASMGIADYVKSIANMVFVEQIKYVIFIGFVCLVVQIEIKRENIGKTEILELLFCLYVYVVEIILYAKSGMFLRYFVPWVISISYLVAIVVYKLVKNNKKAVFTLGEICFVGLLYIGANVEENAEKFASKAEDFRTCVYYIIENSDETDHLMVMRDDWAEEENYSFLTYMEAEHGYLTYSRWKDYEENSVDISEVDVFWGVNGEVYTKMEEADLDMNDYNKYMTPTYEVAVRK